jgi:hypothetical protein
MNTSTGSLFGRSSSRPILIGLLVVLFGGVVVLLTVRRHPRGPRLLNQVTKAREVRPFTTERDPRFDPLPFEREKHGK